MKTDINHPNPAMRDFPLMRINEHTHPRKGTEFRVWPLMNLAVFVDDVESGMTHIIRAKEHMSNAQRQEFLYRYFNKPIPETYFVGRINFTDLRISCSKTKVLIEEGKYSGWDDIRLPFLLALKRRGYQP
ncbi:MAG: glutamate--tRNA ligase, partial [Dehalococcoidia bacterium]